MYIGIDLGTTNSAVAGTNGTEIKVFKTPEGTDTLPSVIYVDKRGHRLYGQRAYDQTLLSPENVAAGFKRLMGTSTEINIKSSTTPLSPEECSGDILKQLIGQVFVESGTDEITGVVITIPAAFNQMQCEATIRAAKLVGIEKVALFQEPIAASMAAMTHSNKKNGQFLVYDLGGGTFDLALVQSISGGINIIAHEGINMLGGRDFDRAIVNNYIRPWLLNNFNLPTDFQKQEKYRRVIRISQLAAEKAKIELSRRENETIFASDDEIRVRDENGKDIFLEVELKQQDLEELISGEISRTIELSRKILKDNGYSHEDIDRIVFIGGPTKMPAVRNRIPQELGIPADLQVDPMTAVAEGAAIYCESREWDGIATKRKTTRASKKTEGPLDIKYDYLNRCSDATAKFRIKAEKITDGYEIQIDSTTGWTSGRVAISPSSVVEIPLTDMGENAFRATVFDGTGTPVKEASVQFTITRTHSSSMGIPATHTISAKVREGVESAHNVLIPIIEKGTPLPAEGTQRFRAAKGLNAGEKDEFLDFELFQDEGVPEPDLNLAVGYFRISGNDLEEGIKIQEGDEIAFHWKMSDSGILSAMAELPNIGHSFDSPKFYVDQAAHQSFDLDTGTKIADSVLEEAESELQELEEALGNSAVNEISEIDEDIKTKREALDLTHEGETTRSITESGRHIRQKISKIKHAPENRGKILQQEIKQIEEFFNDYSRKYADLKTCERFDAHVKNALACLTQGDLKSIKEAESHVSEMENINNLQLWKNPDYLHAIFKNAATKSYLATDKEQYEILINEGIEAIETNDIERLRRIIFHLLELQITMGSSDQSIAKLASIMKF